MLKIAFDSRRFDQDMDRVAKQMRFAMARALTQTAVAARKDLQDAMRSKFDRPTPYTIRSTRYARATRDNLTATVYIDGSLRGKVAASPAEILAHQFSGGTRRRKRLEQWLARAGLISSSEYVVPGAGARMDRYGNMSRGQVQQVLSQLRAGPDPAAYASKSRRSRRSVRRAGRIFWSRGGHLARGAWIESARGKLMPLLVVVQRANYRQRIEVLDVIKATRERELPELYRKALEDALRTAR